MKRILYVLLALLSVCFDGICQTISETEAKQIAMQYMGEVTSVPKLRGFGTEPSFYVFNKAEGGFVIVSADSRLTKIVGYTNEGKFSEKDIPLEFRKYLERYNAYVDGIRNSGLRAVNQEIKPIYTVVEPIIKTTWDQMYPYNIYTPKSGSNNMPTGCVATAISQIMYFYKWPLNGKGSKTYSYGDPKKTLTVDFSQSTYQWDKMTLTYSGKKSDNPTDADQAVAKLMYDVGVAMKMNYAPNGSGAYTEEARKAMPQYFGYNVEYIERATMSTSQFMERVKSVLSEGKPIVYDGVDDKNVGGHAWVVDGYDSNGFVHCNWGWSGMSNGFFNINYMNPESLGTGGGAGGYSNAQHFIVMTPNKEGNAKSKNTSDIAQRSEGDFFDASSKTDDKTFVKVRSTHIYNNTDHDVDIYVAIKIKGNNSTYYVDEYRVGLKKNYMLQRTFDISDVVKDLHDGEYILTMAYRNANEKEWNDVFNTKTLRMTKKGNEVRFVSDNDINLQFSKSPKISSDKAYIGSPFKISLGISNNSKKSIDGQKLAMRLVSQEKPETEKTFLLSEMFSIYDNIDKPFEYECKFDKSIKPGVYRVFFELMNSNSSVIFKFADYGQTPFLIEVGESKPDPTEPQLSIRSLVLSSGEKSTTKDNKIVYLPNKGSTLSIRTSFHNDGTEYKGKISISFKDLNENKIIGSASYSNITIKKGEVQYSFGLNMTDIFKLGHRYKPIVNYEKSGKAVALSPEVGGDVSFEIVNAGNPELSVENVILSKNEKEHVENGNIMMLAKDKVKLNVTIVNNGSRDFDKGIVRIMLKESDGVRNFWLSDIKIDDSIKVNQSKELQTILLDIPTELQVDKKYNINILWVFEGAENKATTSKSPSSITIYEEGKKPEPVKHPANLSLSKIGVMKGSSYLYAGDVELKNTDPLSIELRIANAGDIDYNDVLKVYWQEDGKTEKTLLSSVRSVISGGNKDAQVLIPNISTNGIPLNKFIVFKVYCQKDGKDTEIKASGTPRLKIVPLNTSVDEISKYDVKVLDGVILISSANNFKNVAVYDINGNMLYRKLGDMNNISINISELNLKQNYIILKVDNNTYKILTR